MKTTLRLNILAGGLCLLAACAKQEPASTPTVSSESGEQPTYGSATDVLDSETGARGTNTANWADNGLGGAPSREAGNYQQQTREAQLSDAELEKQLKVMLTTGSLGTTGAIAENQLTKLGVESRDGVVTLSGAVSSEKEKEAIGKQVAGMKGVREVVNNLSVGGRSVEQKPLEPLVPRTPGNQ